MRRTRIPGYIDPLQKRAIEIINYTTAQNSSTLNVPTGTKDSDLMIVISGNRNGSVTAASGWTNIYYQDASGGEWNGMWYRIASSEPASYTWNYSGQVAYMHTTIRGRNTLNGSGWAIGGNDRTPSVSVNEGDIILGAVYTAASATDINGLYGMTKIGHSYSSGDARVCLTYLEAIQTGVTPMFTGNPTGLPFDGYGIATFGLA